MHVGVEGAGVGRAGDEAGEVHRHDRGDGTGGPSDYYLVELHTAWGGDWPFRVGNEQTVQIGDDEGARDATRHIAIKVIVDRHEALRGGSGGDRWGNELGKSVADGD